MYKQILVAVDGSEQAVRALTKASQMAKQHDASLVIAHVIDTRAISLPHPHGTNLMENLKEFSDQLLERSKKKAETLGVKDIRIAQISGNPRIEIPTSLVNQYAIDLLVVGNMGKNAAERLLIGSVTDASIRLATCDVLTVKAEVATYRNLLVAVDGSKQAEQAFAKAVALTKAKNAKLTIAHMIEYQPGLFSREDFIIQKQEDRDLSYETDREQKEMLLNYKREAENQGLKNVEAILCYGNPRRDIPQTLTVQNDIDLLITAGSGRGAMERLIIGSVAHAAVHQAPCDVLTVQK